MTVRPRRRTIETTDPCTEEGIMTTTPRAAVEQIYGLPRVSGERFAGYGVMGAPFASGHYLAMRRFPVTSVAAGFTAVWHRDPHGDWTVYSDVSPEVSCARYLGAALTRTVQTEVRATWTGPSELHVTAGDELAWELRMTDSPSTAVLTLADRKSTRLNSSHQKISYAVF